MEKGTVVNRLIAWSKWKLNSGNALGFPGSSAFMNLVVDRSRRLDTYDDIDSWCLETERGVGLLSEEYRQVIAMEYLSVYEIVAVKAYKLGLEKRTYHRRLIAAYERLGEIIENNLQRCHKSDINQLELQRIATRSF